jgi:hypothetical protein
VRGRVHVGHPGQGKCPLGNGRRQITDAAPWATYATERDVDLVSKRLHNYEFNPVWGILVDQAWLR